jgi:hypothetical protein
VPYLGPWITDLRKICRSRTLRQTFAGNYRLNQFYQLGSGNLSSLSNGVRLAAHLKFVWLFNANYDDTIFYNDPVFVLDLPFLSNFTFTVFQNLLLLRVLNFFSNKYFE